MRNRASYLLVLLTVGGCNSDKDATTADIYTTGGGVADTGETTDGVGDETTTSTADGPASTTSTTGDFVPDLPESVASICDPWTQDCPEGEKCVPYANDGGNVWNANKCVPIMGDGVAGDSCTAADIGSATDDCGAGSICWDTIDVEGQAIGVCTSFCDGTADAPICGPESSCIILNEGTINLCIATCDPLLQDCDGDGTACYWTNGTFNCIATAEGFPTGEPCGYINDCAAGNICMDTSTLPTCNGDACCAPYCDLAMVNCDAIAGTDCVSFFDEGMAPPGYEDVGICLLPE